jgi:hypothetical protein
MAGVIELRPGVVWSTSSWMFHFILRSIAADVADKELARILIEIEAENLPGLSIPDLPDAQQEEIGRVIRACLVRRTEADLPPDMNDRERVVAYIRGLVDVLDGRPLEEAPGQARRRGRS